MAFYELTERMVSNIKFVLDSPTTVVKAADATKVVAIMTILNVKNDGVFELGDELKSYLVELLENIMIQGKFSFILVEIFEAFNKPLDKPLKKPSKGLPSTEGDKADKGKGDKDKPPKTFK